MQARQLRHEMHLLAVQRRVVLTPSRNVAVLSVRFRVVQMLDSIMGAVDLFRLTRAVAAIVEHSCDEAYIGELASQRGLGSELYASDSESEAHGGGGGGNGTGPARRRGMRAASVANSPLLSRRKRAKPTKRGYRVHVHSFSMSVFFDEHKVSTKRLQVMRAR